MSFVGRKLHPENTPGIISFHAFHYAQFVSENLVQGTAASGSNKDLTLRASNRKKDASVCIATGFIGRAYIMYRL